MAGTSKSIYNYGTSTFYNLTINDSASIDSYSSFTTTGNLTINSSGSLEVFGGVSLNSWTQRNVDTGTDGQWINSIIYDSVNSKYVAAGGEYNYGTAEDDAVVWESTNLTSWTRRDVDTGIYEQYISSIIYDSTNSKYVVAGMDDYDAVVWESTDLISWTQRDVDTGTYDQYIYSIIYDSTNLKYVAAGYDNNGTDYDAVVWESTNLTSWTQRNVDTGTYNQWIYSIIYDSTNLKYVAAGSDNNGTDYDAVVWESTNLTSWTQRNVGTGTYDQWINSIIYDSTNLKYVAAGSDNNGTDDDAVVWESTNLTSWTQRNVDTGTYDQWISSIIYDSTNGKYVAAGRDRGGDNSCDAVVWESTNLTSWTQRDVDTGDNCQHVYSIIYDSTNGKYVVAGQEDNGSNYDAVVWESGPSFDITVNGDFSNSGTFTSDSAGDVSTITAEGNVSGSGIMDITVGSFEQRVDGTTKTFGTTSGSNNWTFNNLTFSNSNGSTGATIDTNTEGSGTITINGNLLVSKTGDSQATTLQAGNRTWTLANADGENPFDLDQASGVLTAEISTFSYTGDSDSGNVTVENATYNNISFGGTVVETYKPEGDITVNGNLTINANGTLDVSGGGTWTQRDVDTGIYSQRINSIIYDSTNSKYVAAGVEHNDITYNDAVVWESTNLTSWTRRDVDTGTYDQWISSIIYDSTNSKYVAAGSDSGDAVVWESTNLTSWTQRDVDTGTYGQEISSIIYDSTNSKYVAAGYDDNGTDQDAVVWESTNLTSWTQRDVDTGTGYQWISSIIYDSTNSKYVAAGSDSGDAVVWESTNLISWTQRNVDTGTYDQWINSIIYDSTNLKYVAAGSDAIDEDTGDAVVWESTNLTSWTRRDVDTGTGWQWISSIIYDSTNSKYVAAGTDNNGTDNDAVVWESTNLISWTQRNVDTGTYNQYIYSIIYDSTNSKYVAAGYDNNGTDYDAVVWELSVEPSNITLGGNWTNSGTFTASTGTVILNGSALQTLSGTMTGSSAFYDLTITNTSGSVSGCSTSFSPGIKFDADATSTGTYTINASSGNIYVEYKSLSTYIFNNIVWEGTASYTIYFRNSILDDEYWLLKVTGTQNGGVSYVNVARSDASVLGGSTIDADDGTNTNCNNNTNWNFYPTISISGTANGNNGATVKVALNGSLQGQSTTIGSGTWTITGVTLTSSSDTITVWVDNVDNQYESTAVTKWNSGDVSGMVLNTNVLTIGSNQDQNSIVTDLNQYDCTEDEDIMHQAASSTLKVEGDSCAGPTTNSYTAEKINILSGDTITIGSSETLDTYDIDINGTLISTTTAAYTISHNWTNNGTFTQATSTVTFDGSTSQTIGGSATTTFNNLAIAASAIVTTSSSFTVNAALSIGSSGSLTASAGTITMATNGWTISNSGTLTFSGLTISETPSSQSNFSATVNGALTVSSNKTFAPTGGTITMNNNGSIVNNGGATTNLVFQGLTIASGATVTTSSSFNIAGTLTNSSTATFNPSGGTITMSAVGSSISNSGTSLAFSGLTIAATPTSQAQYNTSFSVAGALTVNGGITLAPTGGTITLNNGASVLNSGTLTFYNLTINTSANVSTSSSFGIAGNYTNNGTFTISAGTITLNGASKQTLSGTMTGTSAS